MPWIAACGNAWKAVGSETEDISSNGVATVIHEPDSYERQVIFHDLSRVVKEMNILTVEAKIILKNRLKQSDRG
jgi:hypothetical protein